MDYDFRSALVDGRDDAFRGGDFFRRVDDGKSIRCRVRRHATRSQNDPQEIDGFLDVRRRQIEGLHDLLLVLSSFCGCVGNDGYDILTLHIEKVLTDLAKRAERLFEGGVVELDGNRLVDECSVEDHVDAGHLAERQEHVPQSRLTKEETRRLLAAGGELQPAERRLPSLFL